MDFGTMSIKLSKGQYSNMEEFAGDVELILRNCRQFNPPGTFPCDAANAVEKLFRKEWVKATERKLQWTEKRALQGIMSNLVKDPV